MIVINIHNDFNRITQRLYDKFISHLNMYLKNTEFSDYVFNGTYIRRIIDESSDTGFSCLTVHRIKVFRNGRWFSHAIFFSSMIPYLPYSTADVVSIAVDHVIPDACPISDYVIFCIRKVFHECDLSNIYETIRKHLNIDVFIFST